MKKRVFRLTESQIDRLSKRLLNESGIIKNQDTICDIICQEKIAMYGSNGDVVKMIQHLLYVNQFNTKYAGGGMKGDLCHRNYKDCDGLFKEETKKAVEEFQKSTNGYLKVDGKFGYSTWKEMCAYLNFTNSVTKNMFCDISQNCDCNGYQDDFQDDFNDIDVINPIFNEIDNIDCDKLKKCVKDFILVPGPNYIGFEKCIGGGDKQKIVNERDWTCKVCKDTFTDGYINKMPIVVNDPKNYNNYLRYLGDWCLSNCDGFKPLA